MATPPVADNVDSVPVETKGASWLVALDLDGTALHEDGSISNAVIEQVRRLDAAGHQVVITTGRSSATTVPVLEPLGITPRFLVFPMALSPCGMTPRSQSATGANG